MSAGQRKARRVPSAAAPAIVDATVSLVAGRGVARLGRKLVGRAAAVAATGLAVLLACAGVASAQSQDDRPVRFWSFSELQQRAGEVQVAGDSEVGGVLNEHFDFGPAAFNFPESPRRNVARGRIHSTASGRRYEVLAQAPSVNPSQPGSPNGGGAHLDQFQAYEKRSDAASLHITISRALIDAIDANHGLVPSECPPGLVCKPIRGVVRFQARAYAESAGGDFFRSGGVAYIEGHEGQWTIEAATSAASRSPLWANESFTRNDDVDDVGTRSHAFAELAHPVTMNVPLSSLRDGELFAVHVRLDAETFDSRGREAAVEATIRDPQRLVPALVATTHLKAHGAPTFEEPPIEVLAAAQCAAGTDPAAGTLQLGEAAYATDEATGVPVFVRVTRTGGTTGEASATVTTSAGSAQAGTDYTATSTTVTFADGDASPRLVELPILQDHESEPAQTFSVSLGDPHCAALGDQSSAEVTISDGDSPADQPSSFTIGGTVDGLQGSGIVLDDIGTELAVDNGPFTFPGTRADGLPYDVTVKTQPSSPDQVCTVSHGTGTVTGADVTDVAVHCAPPAPPSGLDPTFGSDGRVSTPVGAGKGEAVLIQSDGGIITAGRVAVGGGIDFALTRHDADGKLDTGFGDGGIVTTDFAGQVDQANSVAVQPDGKIVVAGFAATGALLNANDDIALARYNSDGTLDTSFGTGGMVITDLGTKTELGRAVVIQPSDGKIVVAGTVDSDVVLVRYTPDGDVDTAFGQSGVTITDLGNDDFANGVALTADGQVLVAGHTLGSGGNLDFALARYRADGALDQSFGTDGIVKTDIGGGDDFAEGLTVDTDGRIVVVGRATSSTILDMAVARYHGDGTLDTGFGDNGRITADFHGKGEFGQDVAIQADGKIVAAGYTANGLDTEFALMRINP